MQWPSLLLVRKSAVFCRQQEHSTSNTSSSSWKIEGKKKRVNMWAAGGSGVPADAMTQFVVGRESVVVFKVCQLQCAKKGESSAREGGVMGQMGCAILVDAVARLAVGCSKSDRMFAGATSTTPQPKRRKHICQVDA